MIKTKTEFSKAMFDLCKKLTEDALVYYERFDHIKGCVFKTDGGRKYIKVKYFTTTLNTDYETGEEKLHQDEKGSIHCFVESTTGDIYKPASWRAPHFLLLISGLLEAQPDWRASTAGTHADIAIY